MITNDHRCGWTSDMEAHIENIWDGDNFSSYPWNWWAEANQCGVTIKEEF